MRETQGARAKVSPRSEVDRHVEGKVAMAALPPVFVDTETCVEALAARAQAEPVAMSGGDVGLVSAGVAAQGEVWSPQLLPYEEWTRPTGTASASGVSATADELMPASEIGLLYTGARGMGVSDEWRERVLAEAVSGSDTAKAESSAVVVPRSPMRRADGSIVEDADGCGMDGVFSVRECEGGYALVGVDVRRAGATAGRKDGLVIVLPSFIDGVAVVRISAEAFARRLVRGVSVRLLVVPDTVVSIADGAFSSLAAESIFLGARVEKPGAHRLDLAATLPPLPRRSFLVAAENPHLSAKEGSLYAQDGTRLLFAAPPYGEAFSFSEGVKSIAPAALCEGCSRPVSVACPSTMERVESRLFDDAVWLFDRDVPVREALAARGVRTASARAVCRQGCWYDFDGEGAVLVAGPPAPPSASRKFAASVRGEGGDADANASAMPARMALPREVDGAPLVRIGVRALQDAPAALSIPDTVRAVERDNECRGTVRLALPEGLVSIGAHSFRSRVLEGIVSIPASVESIGEGCFEYAVCRLEHTGSIVHVTADQLLSCFLDRLEDGAPFDFARYDELLMAGKSLPDSLGALLHRLSDARVPSAEVCEALVSRLRERKTEAMRRVAQEGSLAMVEALVRTGFIGGETFDEQIELLRSSNRADCVLYLMEWHRASSKEEGAASRVSSRERFSL